MKEQIIDLSVDIDINNWEPDRVTRRVFSHKQGANRLGNAYLFFHTPGLFKRLIRYFWKNPKLHIDHKDFPDEKGLSLMIYTLSTHTGTHIDSPFHYGWRGESMPANNKKISDIPIDWFYSDGVLLDFSTESCSIDALAIKNKLTQIHYTIKEKDIVLINTGASRLIGKREYFINYRAIETSAINYLLDHGVNIIGTDAFSFDKPFMEMIDEYKKTNDKNTLWPAHFLGRDRPYLQIERLDNLANLPKYHGFKISCFPIKLKDADASWSRVVAIVN